MHPPLFRPHPLCEKVVDMLVTCHKDHYIAKFWGHCNDEKIALDECFKMEKEVKRKANAERARSFNRRLDPALRREIFLPDEEEAPKTSEVAAK